MKMQSNQVIQFSLAQILFGATFFLIILCFVFFALLSTFESKLEKEFKGSIDKQEKEVRNAFLSQSSTIHYFGERISALEKQEMTAELIQSGPSELEKSLLSNNKDLKQQIKFLQGLIKQPGTMILTPSPDSLEVREELPEKPCFSDQSHLNPHLPNE